VTTIQRPSMRPHHRRSTAVRLPREAPGRGKKRSRGSGPRKKPARAGTAPAAAACPTGRARRHSWPPATISPNTGRRDDPRPPSLGTRAGEVHCSASYRALRRLDQGYASRIRFEKLGRENPTRARARAPRPLCRGLRIPEPRYERSSTQLDEPRRRRRKGDGRARWVYDIVDGRLGRT